MKFLGLLILLASFQAAWAVPPSWTFATLRTDHFDIIYRTEQKELAQLYATASEQAYQLLFPLFREAPSRTIVVLRDDTDSANGMATFLPYPLIVVNPVPPLVSESISDFGDWALELMVHEYTHVLNMHPLHGAIRPLSYIFGSVVKPNGVLPRWYLEGLAVNTESRLTNGGRLRAPEQGASLRASVEGNRLAKESIDQINESSTPTWPLGNRPYLFGSVWWHEALSVNSQALYELNQDYSRRLPFFLNGPLSARLHSHAQDHLNRAFSRIETVARAQLAAIEAAGGEKSQALNGDAGVDLSLAVLSPDQLSLAYLTRAPGTAAFLKVARRASINDVFQLAKAQTIGRSVDTSRLAWFPDGQALIYDQMDIENPYSRFHDLYKQPLSGPSERLTHGLRASEPFATADGKHIVFIKLDGGRTSLGLFNLATRETKILFQAPLQERLAQPVLWRDRIYAIWRSTDGKDRIISLDPRGGVPTLADLTLQKLFFLNVSKKGLLIGSAETGAANIYIWDGHAQPSAITNTKTALSSASLDDGRSELIVTRLTSEGNRIHTLALATFHPPSLSPFFDLPEAPASPTITATPREMNYQPWRYLAPHYWVPFVYPVENGLLFQGQTYNVDPIGHHEYSLLGSYDTVTRKSGFGVDYTNSATPTTIDLSYSKFQNYLGASGISLENQRAEVSAGFFLTPHSKFWRGQFTGLWTQTTGQEILRRVGPGAGVSYSRLQDPFSDRGLAFSLHHREFVPQAQNLHYGLSTAAVEFRTGTGAESSKHLVMTLKAALAPRLPFHQIVNLGERNLGANYLVNLSGSDYLLRGYPSGTFVGRKILNANFEYQMPLKSYWSGWGTLPLFLRNLEGAIFFDTLSADGAAYRMDRNPDARGYYPTHLQEFYSGTGLEFRLNTTAAYHMPLTITMGLYYGLKNEYSGGFTPFLGISYEGLGSIGH